MTPQNIILFALFAYTMGFIAAIPIGATQIEIAKRFINGYIFSAAMIVAGAISSDFMYGIIALFGIAPFLQNPGSVAVFSTVNSVILIVLGILTLWQTRKNANDRFNSKEILPKKHVSYVTGFLLAVSNPLMIFWWLLGSRFLAGIFNIENFDTFNKFLLLIPGVLGIASYPLIMIFGINKTKKLFSENAIRKTTFIFGLSLFGLASYFAFQALSYFLKPN